MRTIARIGLPALAIAAAVALAPQVLAQGAAPVDPATHATASDPAGAPPDPTHIPIVLPADIKWTGNAGRSQSAVLWGDPSPEATIERLQAFGVNEVVVKNGPNSALVGSGGNRDAVPVPEVVVPIDATAAGDGFNAGYLASRISGTKPADAAQNAHRLAAHVLRHRGAIVPRAGTVIH